MKTLGPMGLFGEAHGDGKLHDGRAEPIRTEIKFTDPNKVKLEQEEAENDKLRLQEEVDAMKAQKKVAKQMEDAGVADGILVKYDEDDQERKRESRKSLVQMDKDKDKKITLEEMKAWPGMAWAKDDAETVFTKLDVNNDKQLEIPEVMQGKEKNYNLMVEGLGIKTI